MVVRHGTWRATRIHLHIVHPEPNVSKVRTWVALAANLSRVLRFLLSPAPGQEQQEEVQTCHGRRLHVKHSAMK
jgi:hypothetical protein